jgi:aconitate hydratase
MNDSLDLASRLYRQLPERVAAARAALGRPLTLAEKLLYAHLDGAARGLVRGVDYAEFHPDRVAMQDATAQMALLQFMNAGQATTAVPTTVHCDHLIEACCGAARDLASANDANREVYDFLAAVSDKYGIGFWQPGSGIIHQVVLENYAFPGGMMIGTDSHTPNAGGLGMIAIGVGGADAVDVMTGLGWELKMPRLIGVKLTGELNGWAAPKDVILKLAGLLTVKGGTDAIIEYFGDGAASLSATGKATICNMGAEVGATTSIFPFDEAIADYLQATERGDIADLAADVASDLRADVEVTANPSQFFDQVIEIDLATLEPHINGPFTPDAAHEISQFGRVAQDAGYPPVVEVALIGSCTNSSYEDMTRVASLAAQVKTAKLPLKAKLVINPGSEQIRQTMERDGLLALFDSIGAQVMANACGPCIGQWKRGGDDTRPNSIVNSFNRNFAKRNDGNPNTHSFVASPELTFAFAVAGRLDFNPLTDTLTNLDGEDVRLDPPVGVTLPIAGFAHEDLGFVEPTGVTREIPIAPDSRRLQVLAPFAPFDARDFADMALLIKARGKCTTDHISMAGPWLKYRGHLQNISENLLMNAQNAFGGQIGQVKVVGDAEYAQVSLAAQRLQTADIASIIVAEENYGEGSSREHAAMEPRFLGVHVILVKSFARIHETNLKKQGMLALTFADPSDYDRIREDDRISVLGIDDFTPASVLQIELRHADGTRETFPVNHSYNEAQIAWFKAGSALNAIASRQEG